MLQLLEPPNRVLARLEQARDMVAESGTVDEAKDIHDKVEAIRVYTTKAGYGTDIQNTASEIVIRAKRRIGELTADIPIAPGDRTDRTFRNVAEGSETKANVLKRAKLNDSEASRCERIAAIPSAAFEKHLIDTRQTSQKLTASSILKMARTYQPLPIPKRVPAILPTDVELYCDDARSLSVYASNVDLIVTSPPYGLEKDYHVGSDHPEDWGDFMFAWLSQAFAVTRDRGRLALNIPLDTTKGGFRPTYAEAVGAAARAGWEYRATIVWNEGTITHSTGRGSVDSPNSPHVIAPVEMIALFSKGPWERGRPSEPSDLTHTEWLKCTNGLWTFPGESRGWEGHAAPFPEELPRRLIKLLSFPGDLVCDPFVGSGTSALVAHRLGRRFIGIDQSEDYIDSTRRRLAKDAI